MRPIQLQNITWSKRQKVSQKMVTKLFCFLKKDAWVEVKTLVLVNLGCFI